MRLKEIKNNLAKLYYQPTISPLLLSDFLTVDDGNNKIIAQVLAIESTSDCDTNCALCKFVLDVNADEIMQYSGYVPSLSAHVTKTSVSLLNKIFSSTEMSFNIGNISASNIPLNLSASFLDNFLYVQSDNIDEKHKLFEKVLQYNDNCSNKTLFVSFDNLSEYTNLKIVELGNDFKLPISSDILNYIYENDLNGLTVEQKTIVQDIILEIQDYIKTLKDGYIPFDTLFDVVNGIYESDKSTGVILLRNKLIKYQQANIFASSNEEIISLINAFETSNVVVLDLSKVPFNWQQEALLFALENIDFRLHFVADIKDNCLSDVIIDKLYKQANVLPVIASNYACDNAVKLKSFAKNLILFKPIQQQKDYATYNSFLSKLTHNEFIVSGVDTNYSALIVNDFAPAFVLNAKQSEAVDSDSLSENVEATVTVDVENDTVEQSLNVDLNTDTDTDAVEVSLEDEIAKDVDSMFYGSSSEVEVDAEDVNDDFLSEDDLSILDDLSDLESVEDSEVEMVSDEFPNDDLIDDIELQADVVDEISDDVIVEEVSEDVVFDNISDDVIQDEIIESGDSQLIEDDLLVDDNSANITENLENNNDLITGFSDDVETKVESEQVLPVYSTVSDNDNESNVKIAEGNIVSHPKYGRGVVEELFNYGNRTLCSIQFDNVGRRLLDPNLAELKQL